MGLTSGQKYDMFIGLYDPAEFSRLATLRRGNMNNLPNRHYADPMDRPIKTDSKGTHGVSPSSDAIGGYQSVGWYETFRDRKTGELYRVHCSDGVNGGKSSHSNEDENWRRLCYGFIIERTRAEAKAGVAEIQLSTTEWNIMLGYTHALWLDPKEHEQYGEGDRSKDEGVIGHLKGIPVVVNPQKEDQLPSR